MDKIRVLAFAGSLRTESFNRALIKTAKMVAPENMEVEIFDLNGIPIYNQDDEGNPPKAVSEFKRKVREADAILISTPEYNRSIPGVLKNAIDWASRPYGDNSFDDKPVGLLGATGGSFVGTAVAQYHMRTIFSFLNMHPLERPMLFVTESSKKISDGVFTEEHTVNALKDFMESLAKWTARISKG